MATAAAAIEVAAAADKDEGIDIAKTHAGLLYEEAFEGPCLHAGVRASATARLLRRTPHTSHYTHTLAFSQTLAWSPALAAPVPTCTLPLPSPKHPAQQHIRQGEPPALPL